MLALPLLLSMTYSSLPKTVSLTVSWKFINVVEGYDHLNRCDVYIDGNLVGSSSVTLESEPNSVTVQVTPGVHTFKVVNMAQYEGEWEEHAVWNDYSITCLWEGERNFGKKNKLFLLFDIDSGTKASWKKMPKP